MSVSFRSSNGDEDVSCTRDGEVQSIAFRRGDDRRHWLVCLYGDFQRMLAPGDTGVVRAVVDDFGNLQRVAK